MTADYEKRTDQEGGNVDDLESPDMLVKSLRKVIVRGYRLVWFCEHYGTGSLFWLCGISGSLGSSAVE